VSGQLCSGLRTRPAASLNVALVLVMFSLRGERQRFENHPGKLARNLSQSGDIELAVTRLAARKENCKK